MIDAIRKKEPRIAIGLMSGSSCDGVDAALVRLRGSGPNLSIKLGGFVTIPYPESLRARLFSIRKDVQEVCALNFELGERMAEAALEMKKQAKEMGVDVDFIASHGHTAAHLPPRGSDEARHIGTLQIGEAAVIAERTGLPVVSNFRTRDMAAGGQGAPLVPYADWALFSRPDRTVACLNIGGISNITLVTPKFEDVIAFDTGPGNMIIDGALQLLTRGQRQIDEGGKLAADGEIIEEFLDYLLDHPYFRQVPPKSAGREEFGPEVYLRDALAARGNYGLEALIATVTAAVSISIGRAYKRFIEPKQAVSRLIVSGGGAHNNTLMDMLKDEFPGVKIRKSDDYKIPGDAREAVAFAILGNETICGVPANVPQATGADHPVILGNITPV